METQETVQEQRQRRGAERGLNRAMRACDSCRRRKEKCDGGVPCRRCVRLHRQCEFIGPPPARLSRTGPERVQSLTRAAGDTELEQRVAQLERLVTHYTGSGNLDYKSLCNLVESLDEQSTRPVSVGSQSNASVYLGVEEENFTVLPLGNNITHYSGEFSHWNFSMRIKQWIEQNVPSHSKNGKADTPHIKEYYRAEELQSPTNSLTFSLPPRHVAEFLVHVFFKYAETNYFYIERTWLKSKLDLAYEDAASLSRRDVGIVCILFSIFAIGTQYVYLESREDGPSKPSHNSNAGQSSFSEDSIGVKFYQQSCRLLPDVITIASLESVQACLLIGVYTLPLDASGLSYIYLNLALKLAIQNGMHRKYPEGRIDVAARETRNRVWWSVYTTERRVGIFHGRPVSIPQGAIDAEMPVDRPDLWLPAEPAHFSHVVATLHLNQVLGKIAREISLLRTYAKQERADKLGKVVELHSELRKWWGSLSNDTIQKEVSSHSSVSRSDMHLKLEYCLVRMFTGRPFMVPKEPHQKTPGTSEASGDSPARTSTSIKTNSRSVLVTDCVDAALSVIDTCQMLRNSIGLARASYTEFSACRAALLVIITECMQKKTAVLNDALRHGMEMIKEMAAGGESASSEASLIEAFERAIARLVAADNVADTARRSDYSNFKQWETLWSNGPQTQELGTSSSWGGAMPLPPQMGGFSQTATRWTRQDPVVAPMGTPFFGVDPGFQSHPMPADDFSFLFGYGFGSDLDHMAGSGQGAST